ncbi:unnamed protein product [Symbiodinium pilosum]|uniref:Uncharacterized protein n=1 Tax=Symbiodinium pilosum TaxID=2952 RepID=A0A812QLM6_SYMPI|nr:unnamed protein product [Symbiodinium pilosum]
MAGGQSEEPCDRTWQVNAESGTLQGWGAITLPATSEPANLLGQTETQNVQYDAAKTSLRDDLCDVADPSKLQALLCDNAALFEVCQRAVAIAGETLSEAPSQLANVEMLQVALNHICQHCDIDLLEKEEADELWDGPMDLGVFYQFAREYFSSLCRVLTMDISLIQNE